MTVVRIRILTEICCWPSAQPSEQLEPSTKFTTSQSINMRLSQTLLVLAIASATTSVSGFTTVQPFGVTPRLQMSEVAEETETAEAPAPVPSGLSIPFVKKAIDNLTAENFDGTLSEIEPFLINDAGITLYTKSMRRIGVKANFLGATVPEGYAKEAFCTAKRRAKQDAFIQAKEAEAADAAEGEE